MALGLSRYAEIRHVLMPQAILRAIPTLLSNCVSLFKESALVSAVGMADLMFVGQNISNAAARPVEVLTVVTLTYFVIAFPLTRGVTVLERKVLKGVAVFSRQRAVAGSEHFQVDRFRSTARKMRH